MSSGRRCNLASVSPGLCWLLREGGLQVAVERENDHPFADSRIDVGEQGGGSGPGDFEDLLAELVSPLGNQILPHLFDHVDAFFALGQLTFSLCQDSFQANQNDVTNDESSDISGPASHKFLLKLDDGISDRGLRLASFGSVFHKGKLSTDLPSQWIYGFINNLISEKSLNYLEEQTETLI